MRCLYAVAATACCAVLAACTGSDPVSFDLLTSATTADKRVVVSPSEATLSPGAAQQFSAQLIQDGKQKKAAFTWSSSDPSVATVSAAGLATAVGPGEATITASASASLSGTAQVTVLEPLPVVVAHLQLGAQPFGSSVSAANVGWVGQLFGGTVQRVDLTAAQFTGTAQSPGLTVQVSSNAAGTRVYSANYFGLIVSNNTATLQIEDSVRVAGDGYGVTSTPAGDTVFAGITDGPIYKIDMANREILQTLSLPTAAGYHFEWNQARTVLYASSRGFDGGRVYELDPANLTVIRTFETGRSPQDIVLSADGTKLFIAAEAGDVMVWDIASNSLAGTITTACNGYGLLRTPNNARLYVSCALNGVVVVVNPATGAEIVRLDVGGSPRELSYDASTKSILVPNEAGWVDIIR